MEQVDRLPTEAALVVIADVHLKSLDDKNGLLFQHVLEQIIGTKVGVLLLLGDIFDFTFGSSKFYQRKYQSITTMLSKVADSGTRVIYLEGNHEFDLSRHGWRGVKVVDELRYFFEMDNGKKFVFSHGDGICAPRRYHIYRKIVRSSWFLTMARMVPGALLDWVALKCSDASRQQGKYRRVDHGKILGMADAWFALDDKALDFGLFGHFHEPFAVKRKQGAGAMLCLPDWQRPNILTYDGKDFTRYFFEIDGGTLRVKERQPVEFQEF